MTRVLSFAAWMFVAAAASVSAQDLLPEGPGMDIVRTKCRTCHMATRVTQVAGRTPDGWQTLVTAMINRGATVTEDELPKGHVPHRGAGTNGIGSRSQRQRLINE